ncbi:hypothetical protein KI387_023408, partial [Taxus chinensis]
MCCVISRVSGNGGVSIKFTKFNESSAKLLSLQGDAVISGNVIALTETSEKNRYNDTSSVGRAIYKETIPVWSANFTTHFRFLMENGDRPHGEGLAFFFASQQSGEEIPYKSQGGGLGVFAHDKDRGITPLQRMGIGYGMGSISYLVSGFVELK